MLTDKDITFIKSVREEIRTNRRNVVLVKGENIASKDPITGEVVEEPFEENVKAVVTVVSVRTSVDRYLESGIEIISGDVIVDITLEDMPEGVDEENIDEFVYEDVKYKVIASAKLGLGEFNRVEVIGRREK